MGYFSDGEIPDSLLNELGCTRCRDHFFPKDGNTCKIQLQIERDIVCLNLLKDFYPLDNVPLNI